MRLRQRPEFDPTLDLAHRFIACCHWGPRRCSESKLADQLRPPPVADRPDGPPSGRLTRRATWHARRSYVARQPVVVATVSTWFVEPSRCHVVLAMVGRRG